MRIGVYALAKNVAGWVERWEESSRDADVRVVTDTGSDDETVAKLQALGVTVISSRILPWRWDDAHTQSLNNLPADVDVCVRLDMDETLVPGWRPIVERYFTPIGDPPLSPHKLTHRYDWGHGAIFHLDRFHAREGYRWTGATHEGLVRWGGEERRVWSNDLLIVQDRGEREANRKEQDLSLLKVAVEEAPDDVRMRWYLAREYEFANDTAAATEAYKKFLSMPGGANCERAHACRQLAKLLPLEARNWLFRAFYESPNEPEAACHLCFDCKSKNDPAGAFYWGCYAIQAQPERQNHASEHQAYGPAAWIWTAQAATGVGRYDDAGKIARDGLKRFPDDEMLKALAAEYPANEGPER
jgi:tetratricopeptide (TPR) repeat protein